MACDLDLEIFPPPEAGGRVTPEGQILFKKEVVLF